ncbi:hypothetical protein CCUS01_10092 [Colletotrichum cuscutae]|uniref:Uncharacterized protein n=1 Tax=Colletotrichum cuscutae TaxID=1209917 RepID=A0AAI9UG10_9PEZI|nr:hypothetical protein CCUS01_10092 [Colletotrichum cuscutae]
MQAKKSIQEAQATDGGSKLFALRVYPTHTPSDTSFRETNPLANDERASVTTIDMTLAANLPAIWKKRRFCPRGGLDTTLGYGVPFSGIIRLYLGSDDPTMGVLVLRAFLSFSVVVFLLELPNPYLFLTTKNDAPKDHRRGLASCWLTGLPPGGISLMALFRFGHSRLDFVFFWFCLYTFRAIPIPRFFFFDGMSHYLFLLALLAGQRRDLLYTLSDILEGDQKIAWLVDRPFPRCPFGIGTRNGGASVECLSLEISGGGCAPEAGPEDTVALEPSAVRVRRFCEPSRRRGQTVRVDHGLVDVRGSRGWPLLLPRLVMMMFLGSSSYDISLICSSANGRWTGGFFLEELCFSFRRREWGYGGPSIRSFLRRLSVLRVYCLESLLDLHNLMASLTPEEVADHLSINQMIHELAGTISHICILLFIAYLSPPLPPLSLQSPLPGLGVIRVTVEQSSSFAGISIVVPVTIVRIFDWSIQYHQRYCNSVRFISFTGRSRFILGFLTENSIKLPKWIFYDSTYDLCLAFHWKLDMGRGDLKISSMLRSCGVFRRMLARVAITPSLPLISHIGRNPCRKPCLDVNLMPPSCPADPNSTASLSHLMRCPHSKSYLEPIYFSPVEERLSPFGYVLHLTISCRDKRFVASLGEVATQQVRRLRVQHSR